MIVVADTSVVLNLCCVKQADLLQRLFREVVIPPEVAHEFARLVAAVPRFKHLTLPEWIRTQPCRDIPPHIKVEDLDSGEEAALSLALQIHADAVLLDERRAYEVAQRLGLTPIGILSILIQAKSAGVLNDVKTVLDALRRDANFWISEDLRKEVLQIARET